MNVTKRIILISILLTISVLAQNRMLTVEDLILNSNRSLRPETIDRLTWIPDRNEYSFLKSDETGTYLMKQSAESDEPSVITSLEDINSKLKISGIDQMKAFPSINWINDHTFSFWSGNNFLYYDCNLFDVRLINALNEAVENTETAPNNIYTAYTIGNNLFVSLNKENTKQISNEENPGIVYGQAVHRNEFGINNGIFWSPKSNLIAFYRMDETMVTDYPLVNISEVPAKVVNTKYPMAGQASHHVTVGIYNISEGKTVYLKTGEPLDQYMTCLTWDPSEKYFYIAHLNRDQNHLQLIKYDAESGDRIKILFEEKDNEYVEPQNPLIFLPDDGEKFLWLSKKDGFNHLYMYNTEGKLIKQITGGNWDVISFEGFDKQSENILIISNKDYIPGRDYYKINLKSTEIKKITDGQGSHRVSANSSFSYFIDRFNNFSTPNIISLRNSKGKELKVLLKADNPLAEYALGKTEIFTVKTDNDIDLYARLIYPTDFDPYKKYPVIVYVYGGPHSQGVINNFPSGRYDLWFHMMAEKGYFVFEIDNRGTSNRGIDFEQATFRKLGTIEVRDQMAGVNYLKTLPYIDTTRFGTYGWSYGGFMATSLMLRTDNTFKVGVGGGSVIDWKYYEVMYGERYMDTPETNPDGYAESSLLNYVQNLNGKLLLVNGTSDPTVVWQNSLDFVKKATNLNKPLDYFPYVGHGHGVRGRDALHLYYKITDYFLENL